MHMAMRARGVLPAAAFVLASVLALAAAAVVPAAQALADGGSVPLGVAVSKNVSAAPAGGAGSVDVGVAVAIDKVPAGSASTETGGSIDIGVSVGYEGYSEVSFVGIYYDEAGNVDESKERVMLGSQRIERGGHAVEPVGIERDEYWADAWYAQDPTSHADAERASLDEIAIEGDTVLYCIWKKGYAVKLDANNGTADCGGEVASPGYVMVKRDPGYDEGTAAEAPKGVAYADFPEATRPGYVFKGWYWPETDGGETVVDDLGRAALKGADGEPVAPGPESAGEMAYVDIRENSGKTLYAKWEVAPGVRVELANSCSEHWGCIWFWPGRGYAVEAPRADLELEAGSVLAAPGDIPLTIGHNPVPAQATQYFGGWGHAGVPGTTDGDGAAFGDDVLVECEKVEDGSGGGHYVYRLTERAFSGDYVDAGMNWVDGRFTESYGDAGGRKTTLDALFETAYIRVRAPFEVTFEKPGDGYDFDKNEGPVRPYALDELEWQSGEAEWIESLPQGFENTGDKSVYVSGVECVDVGASAMLPGGAAGERLFSLYEGAGSPTGGTAVSFGWSTVGNANVASVDPLKPDTWIVLPAVSEGSAVEKRLRYGLNLSKAAFNRAAVAVGSGEGGDSYVAKIVNVKYTYSVVP